MTKTVAGRARRADDSNGRTPVRTVERRVGLPSGRAVVGGLLMAVAAVGTFLAYADASADDTIEVLIASRDLHPGQAITPSDVDLVAVDLPDQVGGLFGTVDAAVGRQLVTGVEAGEFLVASATTERVEGEEVLEMSISIPGSRAVGRLGAGDRVDVFSTWGGSVTELIAVDARVLEVTGGTAGALTGGELVALRLALSDFDQVEAVVHAQAAGDITLIRAALGSEVESVGREYRPLESTPALSSSDAASSDDGADEERDG